MIITCYTQHVDPLLSNDSVKTPIARQQINNTHQWTNWEAVFSVRSVGHLHDIKIEEFLGDVFSTRSTPMSYKQPQSRIYFSWDRVAGQ
jgi:hypothetical protein